VKVILAALAIAASSVTAAEASCPDWNAQPHFGQINLKSGFQPDPHRRRVTAGGTTDLKRCFSTGESGYVTGAPDFDLYWEGSANQLTIAIESNADAVLLVNAPDGKWYYNDDYRGSNPALVFVNPDEGLYDIWIGSYDGSRRNPANLVFTEFNY
jgi:hypothetical protein